MLRGHFFFLISLFKSADKPGHDICEVMLIRLYISWFASLQILSESINKPPSLVSNITKTCPCNVYPFEPHFYIAKLGYAGVYLFFVFLL